MWPGVSFLAHAYGKNSVERGEAVTGKNWYIMINSFDINQQ
jgi:hypothetical protein